MGIEQSYAPPEALQESTSVQFGEGRFISESPIYDVEQPLRTSYGHVLSEHIIQEHPNPSEQEINDAERVIAEIDNQMFESLEKVSSTRYPGVVMTKSTVRITPEVIRRMYGSETEPLDSQSKETERFSQAPEKKTIILWCSFAAPPDGHALSLGDGTFDRAIQEIGMVSKRMNSDRPIEVEIQILGSSTGLGGEVTTEYKDDLAKRGLDASADLYAQFLRETLLPPGFDEMTPEQQGEILNGQQFLFEGVSRGGILADKAYDRMPEAVKKITARRLDNPAGHHRDSRWWVLKGLKAGKGLVQEFLSQLKDKDSPLKELIEYDEKMYESIKSKLDITEDDSLGQTALKWRTIAAELQALGRGEALSEDATRRYFVRAMEDPLVMNPNQRARVVRHVQPGTLANNLVGTDQGKEFYIEGSHFFSPYERYTTDEEGNLGTWWQMIHTGRRVVSGEVARGDR